MISSFSILQTQDLRVRARAQIQVCLDPEISDPSEMGLDSGATSPDWGVGLHDTFLCKNLVWPRLRPIWWLKVTRSCWGCQQKLSLREKEDYNQRPCLTDWFKVLGTPPPRHLQARLEAVDNWAKKKIKKEKNKKKKKRLERRIQQEAPNLVSPYATTPRILGSRLHHSLLWAAEAEIRSAHPASPACCKSKMKMCEKCLNLIEVG